MGKRPLRASTLLKKDKDGTLRKTAEGSQGGSIPFAANDPASTGKPAQAPKAAGDVPSREDGRDNQQTRIPGTGRTSLAPAAVNEPSEHGNM